jgi:hypothetical protein
MPFSKIQRARAKDLAHAVGPAFRREREAFDSGIDELEHELGRQVVETQGRHRNLEVERRKVVDDSVDLGVIAHRGGNEADLVRVLPDFLRALHDLRAPSRSGTCTDIRARSRS